VKSVAFVTKAFPTTASFAENDVHRLVACGVRVRAHALGRFDSARGFERCVALFDGCAADPPALAPGAGR
jgi:hypothetical protein